MSSAVAQDASPAPTEASGLAYRGWRVIAALFVILFFTAGGGFYVFPVFIGAMRAELGWTMAQISLGAALFAIVFGVTSAFVGAAMARLGARRVMLLAVALAGVGSARASTISSTPTRCSAFPTHRPPVLVAFPLRASACRPGH